MGILNPNFKPDDSLRRPSKYDTGLPDGYYRMGIAYTNGKQIVICGWPGDPSGDVDDDNAHNCDAMGCGSVDHVLARIKIAKENA